MKRVFAQEAGRMMGAVALAALFAFLSWQQDWIVRAVPFEILWLLFFSGWQSFWPSPLFMLIDKGLRRQGKWYNAATAIAVGALLPYLAIILVAPAIHAQAPFALVFAILWPLFWMLLLISLIHRYRLALVKFLPPPALSPGERPALKLIITEARDK